MIISGSALADELSAVSGDTTLLGLQGDDRLVGADGNDSLDGGAGQDTLIAGDGDDTLRGGAGDDTLHRDAGNDQFVFDLGWGQDRIDSGGAAQDQDVIAFGAGVLPTDLTGSRDGYDLILTHANGDTIRVGNHFLTSLYQVHEVRFADGTVWDTDDLVLLTNHADDAANVLRGVNGNDILSGLGGNDTIYGFGQDDSLDGGSGDDLIYAHDGNDTLRGGAGNDALYGGNGNDQFVFDLGWGQDRIESGGGGQDQEVIVFGAGVLPTDLTGSRDGYDLILTHANGDTIRVDNHFLTGRYEIDEIRFASGTVWDENEIASLERFGTVFGTVENFAEQLIDGYWESIGQSRRSFDIGASNQITYSVSGLDAKGSYFAQAALQAWADVSGLVFVESEIDPQISFDDNESGGVTYHWVTGEHIDQARVVVNSGLSAGYPSEPWGYAYEIYLHEIGHALGLGHAGNYNFTVTYGEGNVFANDSTQYTVMSYFYPGDHPYASGTNAYFFKPNAADIYAVNALYGLNPMVNAGDTTYALAGQTGGIEVTRASVPFFFAVQDSGGVDTLAFTLTTSDQTIDLNQGAFSSVGGLSLNLSIVPGTVIENAAGGTGNDHLIGNAVANALDGGAGNDTLTGGQGNDTLAGGEGQDSLTGGLGDDSIDGGTGNDRLRGDAGADILSGGDGTDTLIAGSGDDQVRAGSTESDLRDIVYGGDGNDDIDGGYGNDSLRGDAGNDTITGGFGVDLIIGGADDDVLTGGAWSDAIFGGDGDDFINGGFGFDRLNGGAGADRFFHFGVKGHGSDWIQDYDATEGDLLVYGGGASAATDFLAQRANTANAGDAGTDEIFVTYIPSGNILWALVDGASQSSIDLKVGDLVFDLLA